MRFYAFDYSLNLKEIGTYPQSEAMVSSYDYGADNSIYKIDYSSRITIDPNFNALALHKKAKVLDLMSSVTVPGLSRIVSPRFWELISKFEYDREYQLFNLTFKRAAEQYDYLFYYNFVSRFEYLDFDKIDFFKTNMIGENAEPIAINSQIELLKYSRRNGDFIQPRRLSFKNVKHDLFRLYGFADNYYVSERLVEASQSAGITGVHFKPIEDLVFIR